MLNDSHRIKEVIKANFLGVIPDNELNWAAPYNYNWFMNSKGIGIFNKDRIEFNEVTLLSLYNQLILHYTSYYINVWESICHTTEKPFLIQQKDPGHSTRQANKETICNICM